MVLASFKGVEFTGNYNVEMIHADSNYIQIQNNDDFKVPDTDIEVMVANNILKMSIKQDLYVERDINVKLYYRSVESVVARRGVKIIGDTIIGTRMSVTATTGSKIKIGVKGEHCDATIKSGGSIRIKGKVETANYSVNAGGVIAASFMDVKAVEASIQFGGEIILNATETLTAEIKAGGTISYRGKPTILSQSIKLGGTIENLDEINKAKD